MASDKKFTPKEAAIAVLQKTEQLLKSSSLMKGDWAKIHSKLKREGYSEESADKIDGAIKAKMGKSETKKGDMPSTTPSPAPTPMPTINQQIGNPFGKTDKTANPDEKQDAELGEKVEHEVEQHEEQNEAPEHQMKGHIKLAKFMGRMDFKRGKTAGGEMDKAETGYEKGINTSASATGGQSKMGNHVSPARDAKHHYGGGKVHSLDAKNVARDKLSEMKQMPKPKLPG